MALLVVLIALAVANARQVELSWVFGTSNASLVWVILAAAVLGLLPGITTSVIFRLGKRRRRPKTLRASAAMEPLLPRGLRKVGISGSGHVADTGEDRHLVAAVRDAEHGHDAFVLELRVFHEQPHLVGSRACD